MKSKSLIIIITIITVIIVITFEIIIFPTVPESAVFRPSPPAQKTVFSCLRDIVCPDCNLILLSVDSLRADHVGAYGYKRDTSPNFDALAGNGILFKEYYTSAYLTPVSEMSLHTGMYPSSNGVVSFESVLPPDRTTLARILKQEGYETWALHTSPEFILNPALKDSFSRGFDRYIFSDQDNKFPTRSLPSLDSIREKFNSSAGNKFFWWVTIGSVHWPYGIRPDKFTDRNYNGLFKNWHNPRMHWVSAFDRIYKRIYYPEENSPIKEEVKLTDADIQYIRDLYDNGIKYFDDFLGDFMKELRSRGLTDKTILVIVSEHGEDLGEHGYIAHYDIFDTQIHTPLLIITPKMKEGRIISNLTSSVDVLPTLSELLGISTPSQVQGRSLVPYICGEKIDDDSSAIYIERLPLWEESAIKDRVKDHGVDVGVKLHKDIAVRTKEWKYIKRSANEAMERISWWQILTGRRLDFPEEELYHISSDPDEQKNVVSLYPKEAEELRKRLENWESSISSMAPNKVKKMEIIQDYF